MTGCVKIGYGSRHAANQASRTLGNRIRVYMCPACHYWHVTSEKRLALRRRRRTWLDLLDDEQRTSVRLYGQIGPR